MKDFTSSLKLGKNSISKSPVKESTENANGYQVEIKRDKKDLHGRRRNLEMIHRSNPEIEASVSVVEPSKITKEADEEQIVATQTEPRQKIDDVDRNAVKSFEFYKANSKHNEFNEKDYQFCYKMVWDTLGYNNGQFDPRNRKVIDTEPHFDIPILEDWAKFEFELPNGEKMSGNLAIKGTIDLVTEMEDGTIEVIDWKTGQRLDWATGERKDYDKLMKDTQLLLYHYAVSKMYPKYRNSIMTIFFCRDGGPFSLAFDKEDDDKFLLYLKDMFKEIVLNQNPKPISKDRGSFKCQKLCHYYKTTWPDTDKTMCHYIDNQLQTIGMAETVKNFSKPGFTIGKYKDPGAVE
jgi:hypothetical protein